MKNKRKKSENIYIYFPVKRGPSETNVVVTYSDTGFCFCDGYETLKAMKVVPECVARNKHTCARQACSFELPLTDRGDVTQTREKKEKKKNVPLEYASFFILSPTEHFIIVINSWNLRL